MGVQGRMQRVLIYAGVINKRLTVFSTPGIPFTIFQTW